MGRSNYPGADGQFDNAPYFNFNDGKVKFNTNRVSNVNDNYGSVSAFLPKSLLYEASPDFTSGPSYLSFIDLIHPPSILPISTIFSSRIIYFLLSMHFISKEILIRYFKRLFLSLAFSISPSFSIFVLKLADKTNSNISKMTVWIFEPRIYFSSFGKSFRQIWNNL